MKRWIKHRLLAVAITITVTASLRWASLAQQASGGDARSTVSQPSQQLSDPLGSLAGQRVSVESNPAASEAIGLAERLRYAGRLPEALQETQFAESLVVSETVPFGRVTAHQLQGRILIDMGRYAEALPLIRDRVGSGGLFGIEIDVALCRLKLGDFRGALEYDVQSVLEDRYKTDALSSLPGVSSPTRLEASLWLDRAGLENSDYLASEFAMKAARLAPRCVAAQWLAADRLAKLGQLRTARAYWARAAALAPCRLQAYSAVQLRQYLEEQWKDRYPQGTLPPPANDKPGNGK